MKLDGRNYSPAVVERVVSAGGLAKSYAAAADLLKLLADLRISKRHVNNWTVEIGVELANERDEKTATYQNRPLTAEPHRVQPLPQLACVQVDGGRIQTRRPDCGSGVHDPHWRESKTAGFFRMTGETFAADPHPDLPSCFSSRKNMSDLLSGLEGEADRPPDDSSARPDLSWRPKSLFRTSIASLVDSNSFGAMMASEADSRGFFAAPRRAFLGDGLAYNWSIQRDCFPTFTPIVDFIHPIERLYGVAKALLDDADEVWRQFVNWTRECWQGDVESVIGMLLMQQITLGEPPQDAAENDPRVVLSEAITYLRNNSARMNYPEYRRRGLPMTSCLIESLIKEMNHRVKGTEKFWNDGVEGEAILQIRAALLSEDNRLGNHFQNRPGSPYARKFRKPPATAVN